MATQFQYFPINSTKRRNELTIVLEVAAGVDVLELRDGDPRGGDVGRLQRRALDEPRGAACVRAEEVGVGHHPERGVVPHHASLSVPARAALGGGGGKRLGKFEGRLELSRLLAREPNADLGAGALQLAPRAPHSRQPAGARVWRGARGLVFWGRDGAEGSSEEEEEERTPKSGRAVILVCNFSLAQF